MSVQVHELDQLPTDLAMEAAGTISSQLRQLPQGLSSLVALAALPSLVGACRLPSDCPGAASDLPSLTLCVEVGREDDADVAALVSEEATSHIEGLFRGSNVAQWSAWCCSSPSRAPPTMQGPGTGLLLHGC